MDALVDGVLMRAGESGKDQLAHIGLPLADLHLGHPLIDVADLVDVGEVQSGIYTLSVQVHGEGYHIHVAGALPVSEEGGLHALRARQQPQLGGGHALAPVVMGVKGDDGPLPAGENPDKILDFIGKVVGQTVLHGSGQVQDHPLFRCRVEGVQYGGADFGRGVHLGAHKRLGGVLVAEIHPGVNGGL